jgi:hypothetical protein
MQAFKLLGEKVDNLIEIGARNLRDKKTVSIEDMRVKKRNEGVIRNAGLPNIVSWDPYVLYDRVSAAAGANTLVEYNFFTVPAGQASKTYADTNMDLVQQLPSPERFDIHKLGFEIRANIVNLDLIAIIENYWWELWVGNRSYAMGPLTMAMSKTGPWASGANATVNGPLAALGIPIESEGGFDVRIPPGFIMKDPSDGSDFQTTGLTGIGIGESQQFKVKLIGSAQAMQAAGGATLGTGFSLRCYLKGLKSRQAS